MHPFGITLLAVLALLMLAGNRRWAALALVLSALYATRGQIAEIGSANFTIPRLLVLVGFVRIVLRGERIANGMQTVDWLVLLWGTILLGTSAVHTSDAWMFRSGMIWLEVGCYFLFRVFLRDVDEMQRLFKLMAVAVIPVAVLMLVEKSTGENAFGALGGVNLMAMVREGNIRAAGPFAHPILAGTFGATCMAMAACIRRRFGGHALLLAGAGASIVYCCASSGPVLMVLSIGLGLLLWHVRHHMRLVRAAIVATILGLAAVMNDPVYFLVARIDISGGSTGYFRAQLIRSSIEHLSEWWLAGTDHTRHWMASGIYANDQSTDITSHILAMGVMGGLGLMFVFVLILAVAFGDVGRAIRRSDPKALEQHFVIWALGALLFGYFMTFWSILLFDQSVMFFWMTVAAIGSVVRQPQSRPVRTSRTNVSLNAGGSALW
jgi:hypothetical protein